MRVIFFMFLKIFCFFSVTTGFGQAIKIKGTLVDNNSIRLSVRSFNFLFQEIKEVAVVDVRDNKFEFSLDLNHPEILSISNNYFYVTPGDDVELIITGTHITDVKGENAGNYLFLSTIPFVLGPDWLSSSYQNPLNFKKELKSNYENIASVLSDFRNRYSISDEFANYVLQDYKFQYYSELLYYFIENKENFDIVPDDYLDEVINAELDIDFFISNNYMKFLKSLNEYFSSMDVNNRGLEEYRKLFESIEHDFTGKDKEALFYYNLRSLTFDTSLPIITFVDSLYQEYQSNNYEKRYFKNEIEKVYDDYRIYTKPIPDYVLKDSVYGYYGEELTFGELLSQSKNKVVYLDFWASWCGPCLIEMPASEKLTEKYKYRDVDFIYLSIDEKRENWVNIIEERGFGYWQKNYWLPRGKDSGISQYLKYTGIPRYVFIDKKGRIVKSDATRPSNRSTIFTIEELLSQ